MGSWSVVYSQEMLEFTKGNRAFGGPVLTTHETLQESGVGMSGWVGKRSELLTSSSMIFNFLGEQFATYPSSSGVFP